jgi:SpoVK/Ycf46/Vps4 family AAA+-type ATPase
MSNPQRLLPYEGLLRRLAAESDGFSGASLAGVARAAASHALERAVEESLLSDSPAATIMGCLVRQEDFYDAIKDLANSQVDVDGRFQDHSDEGDDGSESSSSSEDSVGSSSSSDDDEQDEESP